MPYVIVPQELEPMCDTFKDLLGQDLSLRAISHIDLLATELGRPSYGEALDELDLWHQLNIWSNAPIALHSDARTTQNLIDAIGSSDDVLGYIRQYLVSKCAVDAQATMADILENGPNEDFIAIMNSIRENHRLDRANE